MFHLKLPPDIQKPESKTFPILGLFHLNSPPLLHPPINKTFPNLEPFIYLIKTFPKLGMFHHKHFHLQQKHSQFWNCFSLVSFAHHQTQKQNIPKIGTNYHKHSQIWNHSFKHSQFWNRLIKTFPDLELSTITFPKLGMFH